MNKAISWQATSKFSPADIIGWSKSIRGRRVIAGYIFISPFILGVLFWVLIPALTGAEVFHFG